jgi:hypothetical protein
MHGQETKKIGKHSWFLGLVLLVLLVMEGEKKGMKAFGAKATKTG